MPTSGSQCWLCDMPVRFDTYKGCSHGCKYCFVQKNGKRDLNNIEKGEGIKALKDWICGRRNQLTNWCDWDIPIHWGGMSDPFQPCESTYKASYEALKLFAQTKYPFVVSTKGRLVANDAYLKLFDECNCVIQISAVCSSYDRLEAGCPTFEERLKIMHKVSAHCKRLIVRIQPYMCEVFDEVYENLNKFKEAGAYGVIVEGMKFAKKKDGLVKVGGDYTYPLELIKKHMHKLKEHSHELGLSFFSGENRTRDMGDSLCCCGCDGLDGFEPNSVNINHWIHGDYTTPRERMLEIGTAGCFRGMHQDLLSDERIRDNSFVGELQYLLNETPEVVEDVFAVKLRK